MRTMEITRLGGGPGNRFGTLRYNLSDAGKLAEWEITWENNDTESGNVKGRLLFATWLERNGLVERMSRPKRAAKVKQENNVKSAGFWIVGIDPAREIVKWGLEGDCEFPLPPTTTKAQLDEAVFWHKQQPENKGTRYYIFEVFDNGQTKQYYATENAGM